MKTLLYALSLVVILTAGYFSYAGKAKLEEQQQYRIGIIQQNVRVSGLVEETQGELKEEDRKLEDAKKALAEKLQEIAIREAKVDELEGQLTSARNELENREARIKEVEQSLAEVQDLLGELGFIGDVDTETLKEKLEELEERRIALNARIRKLEADIESTETAIEENRKEIARLSGRKASRDSRVVSNARESVVTAVDSGWGFVVIGAGKSSGFTPQGRLIIKRNGKVVGEVVPSSIEAGQTIAEIDFDTLAPGAAIQPGDAVLLKNPYAN